MLNHLQGNKNTALEVFFFFFFLCNINHLHCYKIQICQLAQLCRVWALKQ